MRTTDDATTARDPRMRALDVLIGDGTISGQADGEDVYVLEVIGFERGFGAMEPAADITSRSTPPRATRWTTPTRPTRRPRHDLGWSEGLAGRLSRLGRRAADASTSRGSFTKTSRARSCG